MANFGDINNLARTYAQGFRTTTIDELNALMDSLKQARHPSMNPAYIPPSKLHDRDTNAFTALVAAHLTYDVEAFASRLNSTGIVRNNKYTRSTQKRGLPDIIACLPCGRFLAVEIKHHATRDKLSRDQIKVHENLRKVNAIVIVCRDFKDYIQQLRTALNKKER